MFLPCYVTYGPLNQYKIHGHVIGTIPCQQYGHQEKKPGASYLWMEGWTSKALVCLATFDKGRVVEVGWNQVKIMDTIEDAERMTKDE